MDFRSSRPVTSLRKQSILATVFPMPCYSGDERDKFVNTVAIFRKQGRRQQLKFGGRDHMNI